jgi:hypothetical protein
MIEPETVNLIRLDPSTIIVDTEENTKSVTLLILNNKIYRPSNMQ